MSTEVLRSKSDLAYQAILEGVQQGRFAPGSRLVLAQLAAELGMSVVPVREAVRRLQQDGLVAYERNVGATVVGIDPVEYRNTMETLALVEGFSTAQCAPLITATELQRAREINDRMRRVLEDFDPVQFTALNKQFHSTLYEHHQNAHILDLVHRGWNRLAALRSSTFAYVPGRARASVDEHDHLLDLIARGAPFDAVEAAARQHRLNTLDAYLASHSTPQDTARRKDAP
ncbi:GntR family transcriptional regulator [Kocuria sp. NPDC057446]|uniref:GntR family transcriptional regulator n=1 Tax=Kocuria sp. NPDC057446 TaxID=3346137 RepID=UPI003696AEA4